MHAAAVRDGCVQEGTAWLIVLIQSWGCHDLLLHTTAVDVAMGSSCPWVCMHHAHGELGGVRETPGRFWAFCAWWVPSWLLESVKDLLDEG